MKKKKKLRSDRFSSSRVTNNTTMDANGLLVKVQTYENGTVSNLRLSMSPRGVTLGRVNAYRHGDHYVTLNNHSDIETLYKTLKKHFEG